MANKVQPVPEGFHTLTPYLVVADADKELEFVKAAFDAQVIHLSRMPDGIIMHVTLKIGNSMLMMGQARDPWKPMQSMLYMYVEDVDAVYKRAIEAGAKSVREPTNELYGDRSSGVESVNGVQWWIGAHIEDVSEEELQRRSAAMAAQRSAS